MVRPSPAADAFRVDGHDREQRLIVLYRPHPAHRFDDRLSTDFFSVRTPMALNLVETDLYSVRILSFVRIDRDVAHAHRVLLRHRRGVRKAHRIAIVENFAITRRRV